MFDPDRLVWTSREEVTSLLLSAVDADPSAATHALALCQYVAPPSAAPSLLTIARARDRPYWIRVYALRAHTHLDAPLPDAALESFFAEWFYAPEQRPRYHPTAPGVFELEDLLAAVSTPAHERIAMAWLARSSADVRARALIHGAISFRSPAPQTHAWLADDWLAREGAGCSAENNLAVLCHVFPERQRAPAPGSAAWVRAVSELDLPPSDLLVGLGPRGLRRAVHRAVVARSAQVAREDFTLAAEPVAAQYHHALAVLRAWSAGPDLTAALLRGVALAPDVRDDLIGALLAREPARAIEVVAARSDADDNRGALRTVLKALAADPGPRGVPTDVAQGTAARALARRALGSTHDEGARYLAIGAVEATTAPPDWPETLRALSRSAAPLVRVRALASLARLGEGDAEAQLARAAVDERRVEVRALAIRSLGALLSAGDHLALFDHALATDHAPYGADEIDLPACEQAAFAVARVGGGRAMTVLLRRAFGPLSDAAFSVIKAGLSVGAQEADGATTLTHEARGERIAEEDDWSCSWWSPLRATRFARFAE